MEENQKVKVVFEFGRSEYDAYLFLMNQKVTEETESIWNAMVEEPLAMDTGLFDENEQTVKLMMISAAVLSVKNKVRP